MHVINVVGGVLYQWDTGRNIRVDPPGGETVTEVHYSYPRSSTALITYPKTVGGVIVANIPDAILRFPGAFLVYVVMTTEDGRRTTHSRGFSVAGRVQPGDYVVNDEDKEDPDDGGHSESISDEHIESVVFDALNRWGMVGSLIDVDTSYLTDSDDAVLITKE